MKPIELVALVREAKPEVLKGIPDARAAQILRLAMAELARQIEATEEGVVRLAGFGSFTARNLEREIAGKKVATRRVVYRSAAAKAKPAA